MSVTTERGVNRSLFQRAAIYPLRIYQRYLSPLKGVSSCRFHPTCSSYAIEAIEVHGALRGSFMGLLRVLRCHPFHPGGYDPVPAKRVPSVTTARSDSAARPTANAVKIESQTLEQTDVFTEAP